MKSMFCTKFCTLLYFWCTYVALLESGSVGVCGLEIKTREDLADKTRQDKTSHLMNCPWCPQGVGSPPSFPSQPFPPFAAGATYKFCIRRCEQVSYLLLLSFIFAFPQHGLNSLSTALSSHLRRSLDALHCIVTRKRWKRKRHFWAVRWCSCFALLCSCCSLLCTTLHCFALFCTALHAQTCCCYLATATCIRSPLCSLLLLSTIYKE